MGQHCSRSEDFEKAEFYFERAENIEKYEAEAKMRHGQCLVQQHKYVEALPYLRRSQDLRSREDLRKFIEQIERLTKVR